MVAFKDSDKDDPEAQPVGRGVKQRVKLYGVRADPVPKRKPLLLMALDRRRCWSGGPPTGVAHLVQGCVCLPDGAGNMRNIGACFIHRRKILQEEA